jgi:hypothetical protein
MDALTEENPGARRVAVPELNVPIDLGLEVYPPLALYFRMDLLNVRTLGTVDSLFLGRGAFTIGMRYDLGGILN